MKSLFVLKEEVIYCFLSEVLLNFKSNKTQAIKISGLFFIL